MDMEGFTDRFNSLVGSNRMQFSKKTDIPYTTIANIQKGTEPRIGVVMEILKSMPDLSAEWLLRGTGQAFEKRDENAAGKLLIALAELKGQKMKYEALKEMYIEKCMELKTLKAKEHEREAKTD